MSLTNIKKLQREKGFTIVELLIVIVVIAILAAIVLVAYNGIQNNARTTSAEAAASTIVKKAEAYNAKVGSYPTDFADLTGAAASETYAIPTGTVTQLTAVPTQAPSSEKSILFYTCSGAGVRVGYWNYNNNSAISTGSTYTAGNAGGACTLDSTA